MRSAGDAAADARHRPVVLDTGELSRSARRRGRLARTVLDVVVAVVLSVGAVVAGGWSVMTAVRGSETAEQPQLWYPAPHR